MSGGEYMRMVTDAGDWIWGLVQGGFNEQQTVSQIIVDAIIGMIPVVGDVTAVRDLLAVTIRLADHPEKRSDPMQWVELVIGLLALIPVAGGAIKGVGKLLMRVGRNAAEHPQILREAIELLNRLGNGNAVRYIRELDLLRYTAELQRHFRELITRIQRSIDAVLRRTRWVIPDSMKERLQQLRAAVGQLLALGDRMIPDAVKELNDRLKVIQRHMYNGDYHEIPSSLRSRTREFERGLVRNRRLPNVDELPFPESRLADYRDDRRWPDLTRGRHYNRNYSTIRTFSGPVEPVFIPPGTKIYRVIQTDSRKAGDFWALSLPTSGRAWRDDYAVLESWSHDGHYIELTVPPPGLRVWQGKVASQVERNAAKDSYGQVLKGGATQLVIDFAHPFNRTTAPVVNALPLHATGWTDHMGLNIPSPEVRAILLGEAERAERVGSITAVTRVSATGVRASQGEGRQQQ
jgi:hypothetical protein